MELDAYKTAGAQACCPLQAEAIALREAMRYAVIFVISYYKFYIDNKNLATFSPQLQPSTEMDWRAMKKIMRSGNCSRSILNLFVST